MNALQLPLIIANECYISLNESCLFFRNLSFILSEINSNTNCLKNDLSHYFGQKCLAKVLSPKFLSILLELNNKILYFMH